MKQAVELQWQLEKRYVFKKKKACILEWDSEGLWGELRLPFSLTDAKSRGLNSKSWNQKGYEHLYRLVRCGECLPSMFFICKKLKNLLSILWKSKDSWEVYVLPRFGNWMFIKYLMLLGNIFSIYCFPDLTYSLYYFIFVSIQIFLVEGMNPSSQQEPKFFRSSDLH